MKTSIVRKKEFIMELLVLQIDKESQIKIQKKNLWLNR